MFEKTITERFLKTLNHLEYGSMSVTTPDGHVHDFVGKIDGANGVLHIHDWRTIPALAAKGDIGLTEAYRAGWCDFDNLADFLTVGLQNEHALAPYIYGNTLSRLVTRFLYAFTQNTLNGSRKNISAHYDLGNAFYALWLDPSMTYSSAIFGDNDMTLHEAQQNKYDRIINQLESNKGNLLEIGCGWGGFADRIADNGDFKIKGITLSSQQEAFAKNRLQDKATIAIEDYRHQTGKYDHIVSIEMFEAVGEKFWNTYFATIKSLLKAKGNAVIQSITIDDPFFDSYRKGGDMIRTFIFPGGMLPNPSRFEQEAATAGLKVTNRYAFGNDYATTLREWLNNFDAKINAVKALGFDDIFIRTWRFYLSACIASFRIKRTNVMQWRLEHA